MMEHKRQADQESIADSSKSAKAVTNADLERPETPGGASFADGKMEVTHQFNVGQVKSKTKTREKKRILDWSASSC